MRLLAETFADDPAALPLTLVVPSRLDATLAGLAPIHRKQVESQRFSAKPGQVCVLADAAGEVVQALAGVEASPTLWSLAEAGAKLPPLTFRIYANGAPLDETALAVGWALHAYRFDRYRSAKTAEPRARLALGPACDRKRVNAIVEATALVRDLINTPAADMLPSHLAEAARALAAEFKADIHEIVGDALLAENYASIHTVGRASADAPRLIDLRWGSRSHPKLTLVGKGVCFDSGGLDIKDAGNMQMMKKDMGGAAHVLGLAHLVMALKLPVRLRVLVPAVENAISGNAMRPLDIIKSRKGFTVEIGNTDAEGRLILSDALAEADGEKPALLLDFATLTGAARVALGTEIPVFFTPDDDLARDFEEAGKATFDPVWRLPLWDGYRYQLDSKVADLNSAPDSRYGGAITAALFLKEFVTETTAWAHVDLMAWNLRAQGGRPVGGEAMALRAAFALIEKRFGKA